MTDRLPCDIARESGNAAYAARRGNVTKLNTAPPLSGADLAKKQAVFRKAHGLDTGGNHA
jgi:hypothetical protein